VPSLVALLLPDVQRLAVDLVDRRFRDHHGARIAGQKEIHVVHLSVAAGQVHTGEMATGTEIRQVLRVDPHQLEQQFSFAEGES